MALPSQDELGTIRARNGWAYRLTPTDVLWLARSAACEGGSPAATAWTYAQRLALYPNAPWAASFASMVRAHSQPVNPIWASADGAGCLRSPSSCDARTLAHRAACASAAWETLPTKDLVLAWARGEVANPAPKATDFADITQSTRFIASNPGTQIVLRAPAGARNQNWYLAETPALAWPPNFVTIEHGPRVAGAAPSSGGIVGFAAMAFGAWVAAKAVWR